MANVIHIVSTRPAVRKTGQSDNPLTRKSRRQLVGGLLASMGASPDAARKGLTQEHRSFVRELLAVLEGDAQ